MADHSPSTIVVPIIGTTLFRLVLNTARRFAYPFAPALSRGLGVSLSSVTSLIAINQITALLGLFIGPFSDRLGYRNMMVFGMAILGIGMLTVAFSPSYITVMIALLMAGLGKSIFDPAVQAWAGDRVPYHRRAVVIGLLETSWSASTLIGIPLVAVVMNRFGWQSPFMLMGVLGCIGTVALLFIIPKETEKGRTNPHSAAYFGTFLQLLSNRPALGTLGYAFFVSAANDNLFVVYGAWLEKNFGLGLVALGLGTSLIGIAELAGEGLTAAISDRIGLKRAVLVGLCCSGLSYLLLPWLGTSLPAALTGLGILFFTFEFTLVTSLTLSTELLPENRATMMAGFFATAGIGRVVGALMGGFVWQAEGILGTGCISGALTGLGLLCMVFGLKKWKPVT